MADMNQQQLPTYNVGNLRSAAHFLEHEKRTAIEVPRVVFPHPKSLDETIGFHLDVANAVGKPVLLQIDFWALFEDLSALLPFYNAIGRHYEDGLIILPAATWGELQTHFSRVRGVEGSQFHEHRPSTVLGLDGELKRVGLSKDEFRTITDKVLGSWGFLRSLTCPSFPEDTFQECSQILNEDRNKHRWMSDNRVFRCGGKLFIGNCASAKGGLYYVAI